MEDDEYIICHNQIPGFALHEKKWAFFDVGLIKEVELNIDAWSSLMMNEHQKRMILSLVQVHQNEKLGFDDVIKGKGKGMIFLLHGEPGVGKTLTAGEYFIHYQEHALLIRTRKRSRQLREAPNQNRCRGSRYFNRIRRDKDIRHLYFSDQMARHPSSGRGGCFP